MTDFLPRAVAARQAPPDLIDRLWQLAASHPDKAAYRFLANGVDVAATLDYRALQSNVTRLGRELRAAGLAGKPALLVVAPGLDFVVAFWACLWAGVIAVPMLAPEGLVAKRVLPRLRAIAADLEAQVLLHGRGVDLADLALSVPTLQVEARLDDATPAQDGPARDLEGAAYLQYTSGSTSEPKGVVITHAQLHGHLAAIGTAWCYDAGSRSLTWMPHSHDYGLVDGLLAPVAAGATCHLMASATFVRDPLRWLRAISRHAITHSAAPPFAFQLCRQALDRTALELGDLDLRSWRVASTGAEPIAADVLRAFAARLAPFGFDAEALWPAYGLAEAVLLVTTRQGVLERRFDRAQIARGRAVPADDGLSLVACGAPIPGARLSIVDPETRQVLGEGEIGEVWMDSDARCQAYWCKPEASEQAFQAACPSAQDARWLRTGDLGFILAGELYVCGRRKDVLIVNGENIHAPDVERVARLAAPELEAMANVAVSVCDGGPDRTLLLQEIDVRRAAGLDLDAIAQRIQHAVFEQFGFTFHQLAFFKPRSLPRTTSGKLRRAASRDEFLDATLEPLARATPVSTPGSRLETVTQDVRQWLAHRLGVPLASVAPDRPFAELGLDSPLVVAMVAELGARHGVEIEATAVWSHPTPARLAAELQRRASTGGDAVQQLLQALEHELAGAGHAG